MKRRVSKTKGKRLKRHGRRVKHKKRKCLCCDSAFVSSGLYVRLCLTCKKRMSYIFADDEVSIGGY